MREQVIGNAMWKHGADRITLPAKKVITANDVYYISSRIFKKSEHNLVQLH